MINNVFFYFIRSLLDKLRIRIKHIHEEPFN